MGIHVRDAKYPIEKFEILGANGSFKEVPRNRNFFYVVESPGKGPYTFRITDIFGNVVVEKNIPLQKDDKIIKGTSQFGSKGATSSGATTDSNTKTTANDTLSESQAKGTSSDNNKETATAETQANTPGNYASNGSVEDNLVS